MPILVFPTSTPSAVTSSTAAARGLNYTFKQLQDEVLGWLDEAEDEGVTRLNVKNAINEAHTRRITRQDWNFMLWPMPQTFTVSPGVQTYSLHSEFYKGYYFFNQNTKDYLRELNSRQIGPSGVRWNTDIGPPNRFQIWGRSCVEQQPTTPSTLTIVSTNAADTATVTIRGTDSTGKYKIVDILTANGLTPVTSVRTFSNPILNITLSAPFAGDLTISAGSTQLLLLQRGELGRSYPQFYLMNNPQSSYTIEYRFYKQPTILVDDNDIPDIPPPFQQILVWDALIDLAAYNTDPNMQNIAIWSKHQSELEAAMIIADDEGNSLEAEPRYVRNLDTDFEGLPRVFAG